jgi:hypothetical protein
MKIYLNHLFITFCGNKNSAFNRMLNAVFYLTFLGNTLSFVIFNISAYPVGFLAVVSKLFIALPLGLIYTTPFLFTINSKIRKQLYWLFLICLTTHNVVYNFYNSYYTYFIFLIFVIVYVAEYIFSTHKEMVSLSCLKSLPYWEMEKKLYSSLGGYVLISIISLLCWYICMSLTVDLQIIVIYVSIVSLVFLVSNIPNKKTNKRVLGFSRGKFLLFLKRFKNQLFDMRLVLLVLLSFIKNVIIFPLGLLASSGYLDDFYVFNSYLLVLLITTLCVSFPESQVWNNKTLGGKGFRLLGFNTISKVLSSSGRRAIMYGAIAATTGAIAIPVNDEVQTDRIVKKHQRLFDAAKISIEAEWYNQKTSYPVTHTLYDFHEKRYKNSITLLGERPNYTNTAFSTVDVIKRNLYAIADTSDRISKSAKGTKEE